jgi:hypothetical protein
MAELTVEALAKRIEALEKRIVVLKQSGCGNDSPNIACAPTENDFIPPVVVDAGREVGPEGHSG